MIEFLKKLIQANSTLDSGELDSARIVAAEFQRNSINAVVDTWGNNRANVFAHIKSAGRAPALLFVCHLDVVPPGRVNWQYQPFEARQVDNKIFGRGTADMKAGIAALVTAICRIISNKTQLKGDICFLATAGEETDSCGIKRFMANSASSLPKLTAAIVPETTNLQIVTAHRGILWLKVTTIGKTAHGSMPQLGINAITEMNELLNELQSYRIGYDEHPLLGNCTFSVNKIIGGQATNVIPDNCSIDIDIRTLPGQDHKTIIDDFHKLLVKLKNAKSDFTAQIETSRSVPALETDPDSDFVKAFCKAVSIPETIAIGFTTDGPFLMPLGCPVIAFGPGKPDFAHKPNEYIEIPDLQKAMEYYRKIITEFLA